MPLEARREKLLKRKAELEAQLKDLQAREATQLRKDDTRRKVLLGAFVLRFMDENPDHELTKLVFKLADDGTRNSAKGQAAKNRDRELLGLPALGPRADFDATKDKKE